MSCRPLSPRLNEPITEQGGSRRTDEPSARNCSSCQRADLDMHQVCFHEVFHFEKISFKFSVLFSENAGLETMKTQTSLISAVNSCNSGFQSLFHQLKHPSAQVCKKLSWGIKEALPHPSPPLGCPILLAQPAASVARTFHPQRAGISVKTPLHRKKPQQHDTAAAGCCLQEGCSR